MRQSTKLTLLSAFVIAAFVIAAFVLVPLTAGSQQGEKDGRPPQEPPTAPFAAEDGLAVESGSDRDVVPSAPFPEDQVILDDLIVDGSACIGFDCVNGESFGFDTLRLKENNLRIHFEDTSSTASFPSNDWRIIINDSANGGKNKFAIRDATGGKTPFTIMAGAPTNSLFIDDGGDLGLGTSTPVVDVHVKSGNTPTYRLEQDGSSGFTPQTWDVAGNEAGFFIRDATNGSTLPFRIRPGAPSSVIDISGSGDVGIRTTSPDAPLDVDIANATPGLGNAVLRLARNGAVGMQLADTTGGSTLYWTLTSARRNQEFRISRSGTGKKELILSDQGDLTITGSLIAQGGDGTTDPGDTFPDYVFESSYSLMPLAELAKFIESEGHLPNVLSADDIRNAGGINMTQLQLQLLQKVEELTLYTLAQQEVIEGLLARLAELESGGGG